MVDCVIGSGEFNTAFREAMTQIYPARPLRALVADHPLMNLAYGRRKVNLAPLGTQLLPGVNSPVLEAVAVDGRLRVIYSPLSMSAGWEQLPGRAKRYADDESLKLGVNVLMYGVSH